MSKRPPNFSSSNPSSKKKCAYVELQAASQSCWTGLLICQLCNTIPQRYKKDRKYSWCLNIFCDKCGTSFKICTLCPTNTHQFHTDEELKKHRYLKSHVNNVKKQEATETPLVTHGESYNFEDSADYTENESSQISINKEALVFLEEKNLQYFIHQSCNQGMNYLLALSYFPDDAIPITKVSDSDSEFNILLGKFVYNLSGSMKSSFLEIIQKLKSSMLPCVETIPDPYALRIPFLPSTLRKTYLEGKNSLLENLPTPPISSHYSGKNNQSLHSYCSLMDCLIHFLAFGTGINNLHGKNDSGLGNSINSLSETWASNNIRISVMENIARKNIRTSEDIPVVFTYVTTFSDAFDPTVSLVKANRHGVWVYQICFLKTKESKEFDNTYVLAIGDKSADHSEIVEKIEKEMDLLRSGRCPLLYDGSLKRMVQPIVVPLLRHADQPERRELYGLKLGKGSNHARWRYSVDLKTAASALPSCEVCKAMLNKSCLERKIPIPIKCKDCANWEFNHELMKWKKLDYFPDEMVDTDGYLRPLRLSTSLLILVCNLTHNKVSKGKWNSSTASAFLSRYCISNKLSESVIDHALNVRLLNNIDNSTHKSFEPLQKDKMNNPSKYMLAKLPPLWYGNDDIHCFPDSPMHLLSGIVKATLKLSLKALKQNGQYGHFMKLLSASEEISSIGMLKLSWFRLIPVKSEKFPGMGSDNFLAVGRYMKIMSEILNKTKEESPTVFPPDDTQKMWNKKLNTEWLKLRELDTTGTATEIRNRVKTFMDSHNCPEIKKNTNKVTKLELIRLYASTSNVLSHLLAYSLSNNHIEKSYIFVKKYLNDVEEVDRKLRLEKEKPVWCQKYNLICLLNSREDMVRYGPCRIRWEGDDSGEKNIQQIKPAFTGFSSNWQAQTHERYLTNKTITKLKSTIQKDCIETKEISNNSVIRIYRSPETFLTEYHLGKAIMMVRVKDKSFGIIHSGNKFWKFEEIKFVGIFTHICRFTIKLNVGDEINIAKHISDDMIQNICIAMPNMEKKSYGIVDMEWRELNEDLKFMYGFL